MLFGEDGGKIGPQPNKKCADQIQFIVSIFFRKHRNIKSIKPHGSYFDDFQFMTSEKLGDGFF